MRLYSLVGADQHVDPDGIRYFPDEAGGFDFPDDISDLVGGFAVKGRKLWETETERADRLHGMELARRRDPASLLTAMEDNAALTRKVTELMTMLAAAQLVQAPPVPAAPVPAAEEDGAPAEAPAAAAPAPAKTARGPRAAKAGQPSDG